ncbi:MAG: penicillin acylase family protein [Thermoleophilia bacterium]
MSSRGHRIFARILAVAVTVLVVGAVLAVLLGIYTVRRSFPESDGRITLPGLEAEVTVYRDEYAIPQIYAASQHDLFMAQGYIHAQERFWQMDVWRHIGAGRLSEMFGESQLDTDRFLRTLGWARVVQDELAGIDAESLAALQAYADGVNAYLEQHPSNSSVGLEYAVLGLTNRGYTIEPWRPEHTLTWVKVMAWDLSGNLDQEVERATLLNSLTRSQVDELFPDYPSDHPSIAARDQAAAATAAATPATAAAAADGATDPPTPTAVASTLKPLQTRLAALDEILVGMREGIGSNSWAVGGDLTATGKPLLANDPHLGVQMPSIWFEIGLHETRAATSDSPTYDVAGFSFAGVPGVVIGHNADIAWGFTNVGADVQDLYVERVNPENPNQYEVNGSWVDMDTVTETIEVAGADPEEITVRYTRHGPVVSDTFEALDDFGRPDGLDAPVPEEFVLALRWTALEPANTLRSVRKMNVARDFEEFRAAARDWDVPSQNLLYADTAGNIGYQMPGKIPLRARPVSAIGAAGSASDGAGGGGAGGGGTGGATIGATPGAAVTFNDGRYPVPGWTDDYEWTGYVPFEQLPFSFNPPEGYIVTANNAVVDDPEEGPITRDWDYGYRAQRIVDLIEQTEEPFTAVDMRNIQADSRNLNAETLLPPLLALDLADGRLAAARTLFDNWDLQQEADSAAGALFEVFWVHLLVGTFGDDLPADLGPKGGSRWFEVMRGIVEQPNSPWWDDTSTSEVVETRDDIFLRALTEAVDELEDSQGDKPADWRWGGLHTVTFRNQTLGQSGIGLIERVFNRGPYPVSGSTSVVDSANWSAREPYEVVSSPSMRMIVDLSDLGASLAANTTGQSGHAFSKHYADMVDMWRGVEHHPMRWGPSDVEAAAEDTLILAP